MIKIVSALALAATIAIPTFASADEAASNAGAKENPKSSASVTPNNDKQSAGTVGAMKGAEGGSFTAPENEKKKNQLK